MKRKNFLIAVSGIAASFIILYACQKGISGFTQAKPMLTASATNVAVGQTVSLAIINSPSGTHNVWSSTPQTNTLFIAAGAHDAANVSFTKPGTYVISCSFVSGAGADSLPGFDTTTVPHDTVTYYPPVSPDSTNYPHDTVPNNPYDTVPNNPHDTIPIYTPPQDSTNLPGDTTHYPADTTHYPTDSTRYPGDSTAHANGGHTVITTVSIVIVVH